MKINYEENLMGSISVVMGIFFLIVIGISAGILKICFIYSRNGWFVILGHIMVLVMMAIALIGPVLSVIGAIFGGIGISGSSKKKGLAFIGLAANTISLIICIIIFKKMGIKL